MDNGILLYFGTFGSNLFILIILLVTAYLGIIKKDMTYIVFNIIVIIILFIDAYTQTLIGVGDLIIMLGFIGLDLMSINEINGD